MHRELTSGLSMPTGFKNSTDGSVGIAVDACRAAKDGHVFLSVGVEGLSSIVETEVTCQFCVPRLISDMLYSRATLMCTLFSAAAARDRTTPLNTYGNAP